MKSSVIAKYAASTSSSNSGSMIVVAHAYIRGNHELW